MLQKIKHLKDIEAPENQAGYRHIIQDNRECYAHAAYSFSIKIGTHCVRSKGFNTATNAANALLDQIREWLARIDSIAPKHIDCDDPEQNTTFTIPPPPDDWSVAEGQAILVDVKDVGWSSAVVKHAYDDGWFEAKIVTSNDSWVDWFNWQEEDDDWKRSYELRGRRNVGYTEDEKAGEEKDNDSLLPRCKLCRKRRGVCFRPGTAGHLQTTHPPIDHEIAVQQLTQRPELKNEEVQMDTTEQEAAPKAALLVDAVELNDPSADADALEVEVEVEQGEEDEEVVDSEIASLLRIRAACNRILGH